MSSVIVMVAARRILLAYYKAELKNLLEYRLKQRMNPFSFAQNEFCSKVRSNVYSKFTVENFAQVKEQFL